MRETPVQDGAEGAVLNLHIQPKAARTASAGMHGDAWKIRVAASPVQGAANDALRAYLAEQFGIAKDAVVILSGAQTRRKRVLLKGVPSRRIRDVLGL